MKHAFTIILLLSSQLVFAKGTEEAYTTAGPNIGGGFPHFIPNGNGDAVNNKVSLRMVARTYLLHNGVTFIPHDSNTYAYSNDRGGVPDINNLAKDDNILFHESFSYNYDKQYGNYANATHRTQTFGQDKNVVSLIYANWKATNNTWRDSIRYLYAYTNGKMVSSSLDRWLGNIWANGIVSSLQYSGEVVTKMNSDLYEINFTYDADNQLTTASDMELTSNGWQNKERHAYEYSNKEVIKYTLEKWNAGTNTWVNHKKWEYAYVGPDIETEIEYDWNGTTWVSYGRHHYSYDGTHNKLVDVWQLWDGSFQNDTKIDWTYNGQNLPEKVTTTSWNGAVWTYTSKDYEYHYYYQTYFPDNISDKYALSGVEINTYPVPASTQLNIQLDLNTVQPLQFGIYNMQGSIVAQWQELAGRQYSKAVPVADFPAGNYILRVNSENGNISRSFVVAK